MLHSSSFHFRKIKNVSPRDEPHERKLTSRRRLRDVPYVPKLTDIFKSLRRRNVFLRRDASQRSTRTLTRSQSFPPPFSDHDDASPVPWQLPSPELTTPPFFLHISHCYRSDAASILSVTEEHCSSATSTSSPYLGTPPSADNHFASCSVPTLATSPSRFQLRSALAQDYVVERLEQHLRQLSLADASPDRGVIRIPGASGTSLDIAMDVWRDQDSSDASVQRTVGDPRATSCRALRVSDRDKRKPISMSPDQNLVPMILITSVDAKHAKPLPPSPKLRSPPTSGTPLSTSHLVNRLATNANAPSFTKFKPTLPDDPFTTQPPPHWQHAAATASNCSASPDNHFTFHLPSFNLNSFAYSSLTKRADPETPTPMTCGHFGDCTGDLWEILHPPLIAANKFTLPPFELPPLRTDLFNDVSRPS